MAATEVVTGTFASRGILLRRRGRKSYVQWNKICKYVSITILYGNRRIKWCAVESVASDGNCLFYSRHFNGNFTV